MSLTPTGILPIKSPIFFRRPASDRLLDVANVLDYIPYPLIPAIREGNPGATDHSFWANQAHKVGKAVYYPYGKYNIANAIVYPQQHVYGEGQATVLNQIGAEHIFVCSEWATNSLHIKPGRLFADLSFATADPTAGGAAIVLYGYRDQMRNIHSTGLPILLTSITKNGTDKGNAGGHILDNLYLTASPRGGLVTIGGVTDVVPTRSTFNNCGRKATDTLPGIAAVEVTGLAGWQMETLKIFSCPGKIIHSTHASFNATLLGSMIDWDGGDGIGIDLAGTMPGEQGLRMTGNDLRILATVPGDYTMVSIHGSNPVRLLHGFNKYWIDPAIAAASTVNAINLSGSSYSGASKHNDYIGFGAGQHGNADTLLA